MKRMITITAMMAIVMMMIMITITIMARDDDYPDDGGNVAIIG